MPSVCSRAKLLSCNTALILFLLGLGIVQAAPPVITLDGSGGGRMFEGMGAMSAGNSSRLLIDYPEPYRSQILDYLFKPNFGASFQDLKVELGGDMNSTAGSEPSHMHSATDQNYNRGFEWWLMKQAKLRNPDLTLGVLAWGAPGWIGNGQFFSQDAINYIINYIQGAKTTHNLTIDYVGILDERPHDPFWIIQLKAALQAHGLTTKIVAADQSGHKIVEDMLANPALMNAVDVVGFHYPRFDGGQILPNKPIWASEDGFAWNWNGNWSGASYMAKSYNRTYISSGITRHQVWSLVTSYYDMMLFPGSGQMYANSPWSGNYRVQPAIWATAHTNQFAGPGWNYIDGSSGFVGLGSYVTLRKGSDYSVVIENVDGADTPVTFNIANGLSTGVVHVWKSDANTQFIQQPDIVPVNGSFSFTIGAGAMYTLTTTTGQSKGDTTPPPAAPFPFPYADSFDDAAMSGQAKYFSDLNGSLEIVPCAGGRTGQCLRQAAPTPPIPWTTIGPIEPSSVIGSTNWDNYQISADVFFEQPGQVKLMGRISGVNVGNGEMYGYQLYVDQLGNWVLKQGNFVNIVSGAVPFGPGTWHSLKMIFDGGVVRVVIDGFTVAERSTGNTYKRGMAGLGTQSWFTAQFDNFRIDPIPGAGIPVSQSQMTVTTTGDSPGYEAAKAIDGDSHTFWNSPFTCIGGCRATAPLPQSLTLALGGTYLVARLRYAPRQDDNESGAITSYNVYVSTDGVTFTKVAAGNWGSDAAEKIASFNPISASYVRLEAVVGVGGVAAASEVNVDYDPGGGTGNAVPAIGSLTPSSATAGDGSFALTVNGSNFVPGSVIRWKGAARSTNYTSGAVLSTTISAADVASVGSAVVTVFNPAPGGGISSGQAFTINPVGGGGTPPPPASTPFVTGFSAGAQSLRNDFSGWIGMRLTVGSSPVNVTSLGRICATGNSGTHTVKLVNASGGTNVPGASVALSMTGCTPGQFAYAALPLAVALSPGGAYYLVSQETQGGDRWYDQGPVTATNVAAVASSLYSTNGTNWVPINSANTSYGPPNFLYATSAPTDVDVSVQTNPPGLAFSADGTSYGSAQTFAWAGGSSHTIATVTPQAGASGVQYRWTGWSDGGAISHSVSASAATFTANFATQYLLTTSASPASGGSVSAGGYYDAGTPVQLTATPAQGCTFQNWTGALGGTTNPQSVTMSTAQSVTAVFQCASIVSVTVQTNPAGRQFSVDGTSYASAQVFNWVDGSSHTVAAATQTGGTGQQYRWDSWSDGGIASHSVSASAGASFTANFTLQYLLTVTPPTGGSITANPAASYYDPGSSVQLAATANPGFSFAGWSGDLSGSANPASLTMSAPRTVGASFQSSGGGLTSFLSSFAPAGRAARNNFSGWVGMKVTVGAGPLSVATVGRFCLAGNAGSHAVKFVNATNGLDVAGASASVNMAGCSVGQFQSTALSAPITLAAKGSYYMVSQETSGGDQWYDFGPISPTSAAAVNGTVYSSGASWVVGSSANTSFVPLSFQYAAAAPDPNPPFVIEFTQGRLRNDFAGWVGMKLVVGSTPITVSYLGRICVAGSVGTHTVRLVDAVTGADAASAALNMTGCAGGQFAYLVLSSPITLQVGRSYYLVSQESVGGDQWYDLGGVSGSASATITSGVYNTGSAWSLIGGGNVSYIGPNFK